jgi:hypothetical protein
MNDGSPPILKRETTWEEWERGRAGRRAFCDRLNNGRELRRAAGDPRKDALLRRLNNGARGMPFKPLPPSNETDRTSS